jgi:hypothetical protein
MNEEEEKKELEIEEIEDTPIENKESSFKLNEKNLIEEGNKTI